ncbi:hypothetical protein BOX15_Mlig013770g1 [Macrostomum lignano]|uniref:Uncharacterized protein n=1 Tax=Macrostomum lignano TaxID=282301 RepID=A0A267H5E7_9PLAT|nr:hypothetical protein BOX15_Mlig013770g1 [Macrostomum lignano]
MLRFLMLLAALLLVSATQQAAAADECSCHQDGIRCIGGEKCNEGFCNKDSQGGCYL